MYVSDGRFGPDPARDAQRAHRRFQAALQARRDAAVIDRLRAPRPSSARADDQRLLRYVAIARRRVKPPRSR